MKRILLWATIPCLAAILLVWGLWDTDGIFRTAQRTTELGRSLVVQFPTYGGYAPGILYNRGLDASNASLFTTNQHLSVSLKVIDSPETAISAFVKGGAGGGVDVMSVTLDMYAANYAELTKAGLDTVAVLLTSWSYGGDAIAVTAGIDRPADLKGKRLACAKITPSHYYALYVLNRAGLRHSEVDWIFTQTAIDAANIFKAARVDACVSWAPDVYTAAEGRPGAHILSSTKDTGKLIGDIFIVKREFANQYPDILARFCRGWLEGVVMAQRNHEEAATYLSDAFKPAGIDKDAALYLLSVVQFADKEENLRFFEISGSATHDTYSGIYEFACKLWQENRIVDSFAPVDKTYIKAPLQSLVDKS